MPEQERIIQVRENSANPLAEAIGLAIGAASVCWDGVPGGVFQSNRASQIVDELLEFIQKNGDGYHSFAELYEHRHALFIALARSHPDIAWRARQHEDGSMFDGMFIAGMHLPAGDISYHLPMILWDELGAVAESRTMAPSWDGHAPGDVVKRLMLFLGKRIVPTTAENFPDSPTKSGVPLASFGVDGEWLVAYGHVEAKAFAAAVDEQEGWEDPGSLNDPADVQHLWAVMEADDSLPEDHGFHTIIRWTGVTEEDENAFPVTVIDAQG